jgi:hypothetical protein
MSLSEFFTLLIGVDQPGEKPGGRDGLTENFSEGSNISLGRRAYFYQPPSARGRNILAE